MLEVVLTNIENDSEEPCGVSISFSIRVEETGIDIGALRQSIESICRDAGIKEGEVSVAIIGNEEMCHLHHQFLGHNETTDVIAFPLESREGWLAGEIAVCLDVARENAAEFKCTPEQELLLYVIHGALHLVGYDDTTDAAFEEMRSAEAAYMKRMGYVVTGRDESAHPEEHS